MNSTTTIQELEPQQHSATTTPSRVSLFGVDVDVIDMKGAVDVVTGWLDESAAPCRFVVTPNVDHVVQLQRNVGLQAAYADAGLVLADGFPLVVAAKWLGKPVPERVAGSELIPELFNSLQREGRRTSVFLLGAMPGVAVKAARQIDKNWPILNVVGTYSPPFGFEHDEMECESILKRIEAVQPDILILGVGAPKQELWTHRFQDRIQAKALFCVGATIDFLAGEKPQAPVWMRRTGLEWIHRVASEPKRLAMRYAKGAFLFPQIVFREWTSTRAN